jgi:hypothetical protein
VPAGQGVLANDSDPDGDPLSAVLGAGPAHGTLSLAADGSFTYSPFYNFVGTDTFSYGASDGVLTGPLTAVTVDVTNDPPVAHPDSYSLAHNTALEGASVLANDSDADGDPLSAAVTQWAQYGNLLVRPDGTFLYLPPLHFVGTDTFQYAAWDGFVWSAPTTVTLAVTDNAPVARDDSYAVPHDHLFTTGASGTMGTFYGRASHPAVCA